MKHILWFTLLALMAISCSDKNTDTPVVHPLEDGGLFVLNQGNFTYGNASLSYYHPIEKTVEPAVFYEINGAPLGDVAQSMVIHGEVAYVVVNNSGYIYSFDRHTGQFLGKITGFESPRQMMFVDDEKAYVSDLYANYITVVSPSGYEILRHIPLGRSSEAMVMVGGQAFVCQWSDYNQTHENNQVMVIDTETDMVIDSIHVGKEPNSMVLDGDGYLWVLCSGGYMNVEKPSLWKIDRVNHAIMLVMQFPEQNSNPTCLSYDANNDRLLFINGGIFAVSTKATELPSVPIIEGGEANFYALYVDTASSEIYVSDAGNYLSNGQVFRYNAQGTLVDSFEAGIIPGSVCVNK